MPLPEVDAFETYGGPLNDYAPVTDPTTDRPSGGQASQTGANAAFMATAMMTETAIRAYCRFTGATTTGALVLVSHRAVWGNAVGVAPVLARSGAGVYTLTYPTTVQDQANPPNDYTLLFRGSLAPNIHALGLGGYVSVATNVVTVRTYDTNSKAATEATGVDVEVFLF